MVKEKESGINLQPYEVVLLIGACLVVGFLVCSIGSWIKQDIDESNDAANALKIDADRRCVEKGFNVSVDIEIVEQSTCIIYFFIYFYCIIC